MWLMREVATLSTFLSSLLRRGVSVLGSVMLLGVTAEASATASGPDLDVHRRTVVGVAPRMLTDPVILFEHTSMESRSPLRGSVRIMLLIDRRGRPRRCAILQSRGDREVESLTCRSVLAKARFQPARDRAGRPIAAVYTLPWVHWS